LGLVLARLIGKMKTAKYEEKRLWVAMAVGVMAYLFHTQTNVTSIAEEVVFWTIVGIL